MPARREQRRRRRRRRRPLRRRRREREGRRGKGLYRRTPEKRALGPQGGAEVGDGGACGGPVGSLFLLPAGRHFFFFCPLERKKKKRRRALSKNKKPGRTAARAQLFYVPRARARGPALRLRRRLFPSRTSRPPREEGRKGETEAKEKRESDARRC